MALSDPQSVTLSGTAATLPRTATGALSATYANPDSTLKLDVLHNVGRRNRHQARVTSSKIAADPLLSNVNRRLSASAWITIDVPPEGFSVAEQVALIKALTDWLTASTMANATKVVGGES